MDGNEWEYLTVDLLDICPETTDALEQASQQPNYKGACLCEPTVAPVSGSQSGLESAPEHWVKGLGVVFMSLPLFKICK